MSKERVPRKFHIPFYTLNIKIISDGKSGSVESYSKLFEDIYSNSIQVNTTGETVMFLRILTPDRQNKNKFYYGKISRFTGIEKGKWVNMKTKELQEYTLPEGLFPNLKESDFVFIPGCHRFIIRSNTQIGLNSIVRFFEVAGKMVIDDSSEIKVNIEQSSDIYERIYNAKAITKLNVSISYTNDDFGNEYLEWMDELLKDANMGDINYTAKPDGTGNINAESRLVKGSLELAKSNGSVDATIINTNNKKEIIHTKQYPKKETVYVENDYLNFAKAATDFIMGKFRHGK